MGPRSHLNTDSKGCVFMPARAKRPCRHKGCAAITNDDSGYCDQHRQQHAGDGWRNYQAGRAGRSEDMVARGKLSGNVFSSAINISVRIIVGRTLRRKLPVLTTSYLKLMVALMMIPIWNRYAGNAIGPRQPERD